MGLETSVLLAGHLLVQGSALWSRWSQRAMNMSLTQFSICWGNPDFTAAVERRVGGQTLLPSVFAPEESCPLFPEFLQLPFHAFIFGNTERKSRFWKVLILYTFAMILKILNYDSLALVDYCTNEGPQSLNPTSFTMKFTPENSR